MRGDGGLPIHLSHSVQGRVTLEGQSKQDCGSEGQTWGVRPPGSSLPGGQPGHAQATCVTLGREPGTGTDKK